MLKGFSGPVTLLPGDLLKSQEDLVLLLGGRPLGGGSAATGSACPTCGFSLFSADHVCSLPQLQLEDLGALLQHQIVASVVVCQRRSHTPAVHIEWPSPELVWLPPQGRSTWRRWRVPWQVGCGQQLSWDS